MEPFVLTYTLDAMHVDCFGRAKPSSLLYFCQEAAGGHCRILGLDWDTLAKKDLFWALIRTRVEITQLPVLGQTVTVKTWPMPTTRSAFPRATVCYDEAGHELFRCTALWVLMNTKTRTMVLPGKSGVELEGLTLGCEAAAPGSIAPAQLEHTARRTVCFTDLDRNAHMNNTKYMDWLWDLLSSDFHGKHPVKSFTACYLSEAKQSQELTLHYGKTQEGILRLEATRSRQEDTEKQERVFAASVEFSGVL